MIPSLPPPPPPMSGIVQADLSGPPPLNPSKIFRDSPFCAPSYDWSPFCSPKNQVIPPKSSDPPSPPQVINDDRSLNYGEVAADDTSPKQNDEIKILK